MKKSTEVKLLLLTALLFFLSCKESVKKELALNPLFSDHMVLQQQDEVAFWGVYNPMEKVTVSGSWGEETITNSDSIGKWDLNLKTPKAGGPFEVTIRTKDKTITLKDVLIGEVWIASGQSNMEMPLQGFLPKEPIDNNTEEIAAANYPQIRYFDVARSISPTPSTTFVGEWKVTSPETANMFSATGYFFARKLYQELNVPIGVITSNWGGTPVESWMSKEKIASLGEFETDLKALQNIPAGEESDQLKSGTPTVLYNGMIHPLIPYSIKGAIWYQGESNVGRHDQYLKLFPGMIQDWRERWEADFPFYFVQIAPFSYGNELSPALRDAQRKSLKVNKTGMAITMDIGMSKSIHPGNKQDVGNRLGLLALANDYEKDIVASGPLYKSHKVSGNKILLEFNHSGTGLMLENTSLSGFEIAGVNKEFVPAKAQLLDDKIEVTATAISNPKYVRYAWKDYIVGTLYNKEGLPASSFTTE